MSSPDSALRGMAGENALTQIRLRAALIVATIFILDQITKVWVRTKIGPTDVIPVIPGIFNLVWAENPGAAFSMLANASPAIRAVMLIGFSLVVSAVIGWMLWRPPAPTVVEHPIFRIALAMVLGGALGNLWDRVWRGTVTDFLQVLLGSYEYPSFNVADSAITIGATLLILDLLRTRR